MKREIDRLAASLCITFEEAKQMLEESVSENQLILGSDVVVCECPMTGTIELMTRGKNEER